MPVSEQLGLGRIPSSELFGDSSCGCSGNGMTSGVGAGPALASSAGMAGGVYSTRPSMQGNYSGTPAYSYTTTTATVPAAPKKNTSAIWWLLLTLAGVGLLLYLLKRMKAKECKSDADCKNKCGSGCSSKMLGASCKCQNKKCVKVVPGSSPSSGGGSGPAVRPVPVPVPVPRPLPPRPAPVPVPVPIPTPVSPAGGNGGNGGNGSTPGTNGMRAVNMYQMSQGQMQAQPQGSYDGAMGTCGSR